MRLFVLLALVPLGAVAAPVTVDFEEFDVDFQFSVPIYTAESKGFWFETLAGGSGPSAGIRNLFGSTNTLAVNAEGQGFCTICASVIISFSRSDNGTFALYDYDLEETSGQDLTITGVISGGAEADLTTAIGTGDWLKLESIEFLAVARDSSLGGFGEAYLQLDNVVLEVVPIPAAAWMFMSALGMLVLRRR